LNLGSAGHGTMTADELRSAATLHLPLTLIRLWGSHRSTSHHFRYLVNFLHLVEAVDLLLRRSTFEARRVAADGHLIAYVNGIMSLFPEHRVAPNQHLSFHIGRFLEGLGPAWCISAWFPEYFNQILEGFNTNHRIGEIF